MRKGISRVYVKRMHQTTPVVISICLLVGQEYTLDGRSRGLLRIMIQRASEGAKYLYWFVISFAGCMRNVSYLIGQCEIPNTQIRGREVRLL